MSGNDDMDILLDMLRITPWVVCFYFVLNAFTSHPLPGLKKLSEKIDRQDFSTLILSIVFILALFYGILRVVQFFLTPFTEP